MRRIIVILTLVLCFAVSEGNEAHAQRQLPGMRGIQVTAGMTDGIYSKKADNKVGYCFGAAMSLYAKRGNKWMFGAEFMERYYPYRQTRLPVAQFTAEGGYYFKFLSDGSKTVFFSVGGSALAGYETVNRGKRLLYDGSTIRNKDAFLYGGAITLEMETYLTDGIILLLTGRERILWGNTTGRFHTQFGVGLRFMLD